MDDNKTIEQLTASLKVRLEQILASTNERLPRISRETNLKKKLFDLYAYTQYIERKSFEMRTFIEDFTIKHKTKFGNAIEQIPDERKFPKDDEPF